MWREDRSKTERNHERPYDLPNQAPAVRWFQHAHHRPLWFVTSQLSIGVHFVGDMLGLLSEERRVPQRSCQPPQYAPWAGNSSKPLAITTGAAWLRNR